MILQRQSFSWLEDEVEESNDNPYYQEPCEYLICIEPLEEPSILNLDNEYCECVCLSSKHRKIDCEILQQAHGPYINHECIKNQAAQECLIRSHWIKSESEESKSELDVSFNGSPE